MLQKAFPAQLAPSPDRLLQPPVLRFGWAVELSRLREVVQREFPDAVFHAVRKGDFEENSGINEDDLMNDPVDEDREKEMGDEKEEEDEDEDDAQSGFDSMITPDITGTLYRRNAIDRIAKRFGVEDPSAINFLWMRDANCVPKMAISVGSNYTKNTTRLTMSW
ncbi:hypothetical protein K488DRAFT_72072 [Vararia minispora EC-137]|uniref:Uncharacterized protein n=1 Tax=Vararia minispora EC-137 TaxID=1314806 RepID=A0ACB8QG38_9AGAM|nr:hypothetical protein K488DRAFT_72072 [Vararia minispora EC-137]